jgi:DNA modification methylase
VNSLYAADSLQVLRDKIPDASVDLIYADPPFELAEGEIRASRNSTADDLSHNWLENLALHVVEWKRVLRSTGSVYMHTDSRAAPGVRLLFQHVFGSDNVRNEIIWRSRRLTTSHSSIAWPTTTERILYVTRSEASRLSPIYHPLPEDKIKREFRHIDRETGRRYRLVDLLSTAEAARGPNSSFEFMGVFGQWRLTPTRLIELEQLGLLHRSRANTPPRLKQYLDEQRGPLIGDLWDDIPLLSPQSREWTGYPTQKPELIAERIIAASSTAGGVLLDPFCGSGSTIIAAHRAGLSWVGIDSNQWAIALTRNRILRTFGDEAAAEISSPTDPTSMAAAEELANESPSQFEAWVLTVLGATPNVQGHDGGIDGSFRVYDDPESVTPSIIAVEVRTRTASYRDIKGLWVHCRQDLGAKMLIVVSLESPSAEIQAYINETGLYSSPEGTEHSRIQWLTLSDLFDGRQLNLPAPTSAKNIPQGRTNGGEQANVW